MEVREVNIAEITPYERNAKKHPEKQIEQIAESIKQYGFKQPLVISKDGTIVIGHGRYEAALLLRMDTVPCVLADDLTEDEARELRVADNKLNESDWDMDILMEEIADLDFGNLDLDFGEAGTELNQDLLDEYFNNTEDNAELAKKKTVTCPYCGETFEV